MSKVIEGIYEIEKQIGAGGGGIVYLGRHIRLQKQIVLKADKRTLKSGSDVLRREVDMLKGLSHTYIPQVYDFVQEDGVVYTVMDFIDGESLDKLLERKQVTTQPQVIKWACQILEALCYLHSRPPHGILHGDIKPANIMLRPNGDVCLIDFNIALALGEDGAVKVGFSRGYASPEHYGIEYTTCQKAESNLRVSNIKGAETTEVEEKDYEITEIEKVDLESTETDVKQKLNNSRIEVRKNIQNSSYTNEKKQVKLDVRSDIYSLGATLYHLLSGNRPSYNANEVVPLGKEVCSEAVSLIIQKAMAPNPNNRYQSAEEMLNAFLKLCQNDKRTRRHKRNIIITFAALVLTFLIGGMCTFIGLKQMEQRQKALVLAEYSESALQKGNVLEAVNMALQAIPKGQNIFEAPMTAQAQKALTDALGVYNLADGFKALNIIELPSAPFDIKISPGETYFAVVYAYEVAVYRTDNQQKIISLPTQKSAMADVVFAGEEKIIYAGEKGITAYDLNEQKVLWVGEVGTSINISADLNIVATVNRDVNGADIYRVSDGKKILECSFNGLRMNVPVNDIFADSKSNIFAINEDGSKLAVSFNNGGLTIFDLKNTVSDIVFYNKSEYQKFKGGFYGKYFAFSAQKSGESKFGLIDTDSASCIGEYSSKNDIFLKANDKGIYLADGNILVDINPETMSEKELAYINGANIIEFSVGKKYSLVATDKNTFAFYDSGANISSTVKCDENCDYMLLSDNYALIGNRNEPYLRIMKLEEHNESQVFEYDPRYKHDEARISMDGNTAMLFSYEGFCVCDRFGNILALEEIPNAESVYDQQFIRTDDGSWLEIIWYDGTLRRYSASDGSILSEEMVQIPPKDLYEEFYTDKYRIESELHAAPRVYDIASDKLLAYLEEESYLTYVTQLGEYIVTEYISASGDRYGILLDDNLDEIARLPNLCDIYKNTFVFDYKSGNLRQCRFYSIQELIALGQEVIK